MECKIFDGRVILTLTGNNMKGIVVTEGLLRSIPESIGFDGEQAILFANLALILSRTRQIEFQPDENDPIILDMMKFWGKVQSSDDYKYIWSEFLFLDVEINNQWMRYGINFSDNARLKAPQEVRPGAPSDEVLEASPNGLEKKKLRDEYVAAVERRAIDIIKTRQTHDSNGMKLTRPNLRWENDGFLALHEASIMMATGRKEVRDINTVATVDPEWESDVATSYLLLNWVNDYYSSLSPEMRAALEKEQEAPLE